MTVGFYTLGCKVNQYETQALARLLEQQGWVSVPLEAGPDVVVINTCTVTAESDRKDRQILRRLRRQHPDAVLVLTGCFPQAFPAEAQALQEADIVTGNACHDRLPTLLQRFLTDGARVVEIPPHGKVHSSLAPDGFGERTRAYLKIEDGCDRFCTYCIIPTSRGRVRSKPLADVAQEAAELAARGFTELVLVGINLSAYRDGEHDLADAVAAAAAPAGVSRVRLGSLEPDQLTPAVIDRLAACGKLCPQFHLSLQSGCDATLRRMNRHYDTAFYRDLCARLRARFGGEAACAVTTDVMVGFPGESEEEFAASLAFVQEIGFARTHVFAYSRRPGTPAARAQGQIPAAEKQRRSQRMIACAHRAMTAFLQAQIGREEILLPESRGEDGWVEGYTANYTPVRVRGEGLTPGLPVRVRLTAVEGDACVGEPV